MACVIEIVPRSQADLEQLYTLARCTFGDLPDWNDDRVLEVLRRDVVFVARERAHAAGYVALIPDRSTASVVVEHLFVVPGHERRGIGRRLLEFAEGYAIAERMRALRIVAERGNWRAREFYRQAGFVPVEAELMELVLPRSG